MIFKSNKDGGRVELLHALQTGLRGLCRRVQGKLSAAEEIVIVPDLALMSGSVRHYCWFG